MFNCGECIDLFVARNNIVGVSIVGEYGLASVSGMAITTKSVAGTDTPFYKERNSKDHLDNVWDAYTKATNLA